MPLSRRRFVGATGVAVSAMPLAINAEPQAGFLHGVASGDPLADRLILWSRLSGYADGTAVTLQVASSPQFDSLVTSKTLLAKADADYTLKIDVDGLQPDSHYYYRFFTERHASPIGRTRTLAGKDTEAIKLAVVSCSNYPAGYFNVYRTLGNYNDIDAVVHLGDYIYEYPVDGYASARAGEFGRLSDPPHEVTALAHYRRRYQQYRSDPDLQYAHGRLPFIAIWDDHEIANDAWVEGAQNHSDDEGSYAQRRKDAVQAFYEWLPVREPESQPLDSPYRRFDFGRIATLAMLESRLSARAQPLSRNEAAPPKDVWYARNDSSIRLNSQPEVDIESFIKLPAIAQVINNRSVEITDFAEHQRIADASKLGDNFHYIPDTDRFWQELNKPRAMLGDTQMKWLGSSLNDSVSKGTRWQILGNQTLLSRVNAPNFQAALSADEQAQLPGYIRGLVPLSQYQLPINLDSWDGYPQARQRLYDLVPRPESLLAIAGDTHNAWAGPLSHPVSGRYAGYEVATPSVSSPGLAETFGIKGTRLKDLLAGANPHFDYLQMSSRGYLLLELTETDAKARFHYVNRIDQRRFFVSADQPLTIGK